MGNVTKVLIGIAALAFLLADTLTTQTMTLPGEAFSRICNLLALFAFALILMAKKLTI